MAVETHQHETTGTLPGPAERPEADIVIYDGACRMCTRQIRFLDRLDRGSRLAFLSLHDRQVASIAPDLTPEALLREMWIIERSGQRHAGAAAGRYLSRRLPLLWWLAPLLHVPGSLPLWQWCYRQIASRRYLFGRNPVCDDDACQIHFSGRKS